MTELAAVKDLPASKPEEEAKRGAGRPPFEPTKVQRKRVAIAAGGGMSHEEIALGLGICRNTLELHFQFELTEGAYARRIEVLEALHKAAKKGNVAAIKAYTAIMPGLAVPPLEKPEQPTRAEGVKAERQEAAKTAQDGTGWDGLLPRPSAPPQLALVKGGPAAPEAPLTK